MWKFYAIFSKVGHRSWFVSNSENLNNEKVIFEEWYDESMEVK